MHAAIDSRFPPELLDEFIDQLNETSTLLSCGLVCKRALVKTRCRLFSTLEFTSSDKDFGWFLDLAGAPWTSFTSAVKEIHLQDMKFWSHDVHYRNERDPKTVASNLCNVKTLSIFLHPYWSQECGWTRIPRSVLDVIFELKIHDLQLTGVGMTKATDMRLQLEDSNLSSHLSLFRRPLHFKILDNVSLAFFKDVFDPLTNPGLDLTVNTFHIRDPDFTVSEAYNPLTWRFLEHIGHGVEQLLITFCNPRTSAPFSESIKYLEPSQVVQCINLRSLFIQFRNYSNFPEDPTPSLVSAMWKILSALPSPNLLEEFQFKFYLYENLEDEYLAKLGFFDSPNCLDKFRSMFPNLKLIKIILVIHENDMCFEASRFEPLRRVKGLRELEEIGVVKLVAFYSYIEEHVACHSILETCRIMHQY